MNVFELRALTTLENSPPTEKSFYEMIDHVLVTAAQHGATSIKFDMSSFAYRLVQKYMEINGFEKTPHEAVWFWFEEPKEQFRYLGGDSYQVDAEFVYAPPHEVALKMFTYKLVEKEKLRPQHDQEFMESYGMLYPYEIYRITESHVSKTFHFNEDNKLVEVENVR